MNLIEALTLALADGVKVRPCCWRTFNPDHWVERLHTPHHTRDHIFVERGTREEIPHSLRLRFPTELLGDWEVVELDEWPRVKGVRP